MAAEIKAERKICWRIFFLDHVKYDVVFDRLVTVGET